MAGAVPQPLGYGEIVAYARDHDLAESTDELDFTVQLLGQLDAAFLKHMSDQAAVKR